MFQLDFVKSRTNQLPTFLKEKINKIKTIKVYQLPTFHWIILSIERDVSRLYYFRTPLLGFKLWMTLMLKSIWNNDIKETLICASGTYNVKITHIYRSGNLVVHSQFCLLFLCSMMLLGLGFPFVALTFYWFNFFEPLSIYEISFKKKKKKRT